MLTTKDKIGLCILIGLIVAFCVVLAHSTRNIWGRMRSDPGESVIVDMRIKHLQK